MGGFRKLTVYAYSLPTSGLGRGLKAINVFLTRQAQQKQNHTRVLGRYNVVPKTQKERCRDGFVLAYPRPLMDGGIVCPMLSRHCPARNVLIRSLFMARTAKGVASIR